MDNNFSAIVLAAGEGKRMKSDIPKVLLKICGLSMVEHVLMNLKEAGINDICVVVGGKNGEAVKEQLGNSYEYAVQEPPRGTADAVNAAKDFIRKKGGKVLVMCADAPLQSAAAIKEFIEVCDENKLDLGVMSAVLPDPANYGRIYRENKKLVKIIERRDCTDEQLKINEINSGTYLFDAEKLLNVLLEIDCDNAQNEYYLTDTVEKFCLRGYRAAALVCGDNDIVRGANDLYELSECEKKMRLRINKSLMLEGVKIIDPENTYIDRTVKIGIKTVIYPNTFIEGKTVIGESNTIISGRITDCVIGNGNKIDNSVLESSTIRDNNTVGPYAHIRPHTEIKDNIRIGNFVEIKASTIDDGSKVSHLTYIGDGVVGKNVNMGCGVVFANYDGVKKHTSVVEDNAFIGCNTNLVSPVKIGKGALIGAGTTITKDVEPYTLVVGRSRQQTVRKLEEPEE